MKRPIKLLPIVFLVGLSFNSFAGSSSPTPWSPSVQPKDCLLTGTQKSNRLATADEGWIHFRSAQGTCYEALSRGYATGVTGTAEIQLPHSGTLADDGTINRTTMTFKFTTSPTLLVTTPVPIARGSSIKILTAEWAK